MLRYPVGYFNLFMIILSVMSHAHAAEPVPPRPPQSYALPDNPVYVATTSEFADAFTSSIAKDIVLRDGIYSNNRHLSAGATHRVWAEHLGKATLSFGLLFQTPRCELHGITFDVSNKRFTSSGTIIATSGEGEHLTVADCWILGHRKCASGIFARATNGLVVKRCVIRGFTDYGLAWMAYHPAYVSDAPEVPPVIEDIEVSTVYNSPKSAMDGTGEAGIWAGTKFRVSRVRITDVSWMGLWTGANCNDSVFSDLIIDNITPEGQGIYIERFTRRCVFQNFRIGPPRGTFPWQPDHCMQEGIVTEWDDPTGANPNGGTNAASHDNHFRGGFINSSYLGFCFEDAESSLVEGVTFVNQSAAGIKEFRTHNANYNVVWQKRRNDFSGLGQSAVERTTDHAPLGFSIQPLDAKVRLGRTVKLAAEATGGYGKFAYQWQRNRVSIKGATKSTYSFVADAVDMHGKFRVIATSTDGSVTSIEANVEVSGDSPAGAR